MSDLKFNQPLKPSALVRKSGAPGGTRTLQNANREALHLLGQPMDTPGDPKGRVLRQLRLQVGIDPSVLATQACMSLSQLYELEEGGYSRFYSDSLRRQAGRRVAQLLGADWDTLGNDKSKPVRATTSNVVHLLRPATVTASQNAGATASQTDGEHEPRITMTADEPHQVSSVKETQAVAMGLTTPASETLLVDPNTPPYMADIATVSERKASGWGGVVLTLLLITAAGAAGAYAFVEYSPYRLYWPW